MALYLRSDLSPHCSRDRLHSRPSRNCGETTDRASNRRRRRMWRNALPQAVLFPRRHPIAERAGNGYVEKGRRTKGSRFDPIMLAAKNSGKAVRRVRRHLFFTVGDGPPVFLAAAHRAFIAAASFARPSGVRPLFLLPGILGAPGFADSFCFAQRAFCAAAILARAAALIVRLPRGFLATPGSAANGAEPLPKMESNRA